MLSLKSREVTVKAFKHLSSHSLSYQGLHLSLHKLTYIMSRNHSSGSSSAKAESAGGRKSFEEVKIPVPWGHISGKWWGSQEVTPLIGLHGIQDNAGTFDRLAPLLDVPAFLALDAPGHGCSSHFPVGMSYNFLDFVVGLRRVVRHFGWNKISILGHSFGSATGLVYSALYPEQVQSFISIECARVLMALAGVTGLPRIKDIIEKTVKSDSLLVKDPPGYDWEKLVGAYCEANHNSMSKEDAVCILSRGTNPHPKIAGAFFFSRDPRLRFVDFGRPNIDLQVQCAESVKCHVMTVYGKQGLILNHENPEIPQHYQKQEMILKKSAGSFVRHELTGTHHLHLGNSENVARVVNDFLKYCMLVNVNKSRIL